MQKSDIILDKVIQVYSGKPGCACGCRGTHSYASKYAEEASKSHGYQVHVSDRSIKLIYKKVMESPDSVLDDDCDNVSLETDTRLLVVYFKR